MDNTVLIPDGYVLVPVAWAEKYFNKSFWSEIQEPNINEVAEYLGIGIEKIKKDLRNIDCPLRKSEKSRSGRGNKTKFHKWSVEEYKVWLRNK
ncbi:hypothetical protein EG359_17250 [Chryseobacterium joostei]|uniref:DNA-binding protein n=1 Tax=Chryseobacterium joostei TaxID=112234 RepID=A0A1N7IAU9_9FLAO|nr:hypothetical protein [Chryseobacterium joostei]AZB01251.1 hypothetical protein EG359_17250 [Chryseobacterium joostei]SIS34211.1 hypothetical protein SAMN05421768_103647 [Chryseobacterium joostei]